MKVGLISLGCAKNLVDSEMVLGMLRRAGHIIINSPQDADAIIINTCGFIDTAKQESIDNIIEMIGYKKKTIVIGCLVERFISELEKAIPEVDLWVPISDYAQLNSKISTLFADQKQIPVLKADERVYSTPKYSAYLRISEGCNHRCTYCAIPLIRGGFRSRPFAEVINEAQKMADNGIKELVIISQDTTYYGHDLGKNVNIITLLKAIIDLKCFVSIRLLYLYPLEVTDAFIDFVANHPVIAPYFDLPIQHSSNRLRKLMHRLGTRAELIERIQTIRSRIPHAIIRTTMIVGFPYETEEDHADLIDFIKTNDFDHLGAFTYSREEHTVAYDYAEQVPEDVKKARYEDLMKAQRQISYRKNKAHVGEIMTGIVIGYDKKHDLFLLRSAWNAPDDIDGKITFTSDRILVEGQIVNFNILDAYVYDLHGMLVSLA